MATNRFLKFASPEFPLRPSALTHLVRCAGSVALPWEEIAQVNTLGGAAAQTGNLVHEAAAAFHKTANDVEAGNAALQLARDRFPGGDVSKAQGMFDAYAADQENLIVVPFVEFPVSMSLEPLADDPSGYPVVITGTCDQIRRGADDKLYIWDIKTGSRLDIKDTLDYYAYQISAYAVAATQTIGETVHPGGVIYTEGYAKPRAPRRRFCPWKYDTALHHMKWIQRIVTEIRKGNVPVTPGESCKYCVYKSVETCTPILRETVHACSN